jgi:hypothetical protein
MASGFIFIKDDLCGTVIVDMLNFEIQPCTVGDVLVFCGLCETFVVVVPLWQMEYVTSDILLMLLRWFLYKLLRVFIYFRFKIQTPNWYLRCHLTNVSRGSSVRILTWVWAERPVFDSRQGKGNIFYFRHRVQTGSGTHPSIQCVAGALYPEVMQLTAHLHLVLRLRMCEPVPPLPHKSLWHGVLLSTGTLLPSYELIPWSRVFLEKPIVTQLVKTFPPAFHEIRRFITVRTRAR